MDVYLDDTLVHSHEFNCENHVADVELDKHPSIRTVRVVRHSKTNDNVILADGNILHDQILEITEVSVDGIAIKDGQLRQLCQFEYNNQVDRGSLYFGPNGVWTLFFETPIITFLLDENIKHMSGYSEDYKYPWSYQLGPESVGSIISEIQQIETKVQKLL
jgi:hypothetical protein